MSPSAKVWDEEHQAERPTVEVLERLGYTYVASETLDAERGSYTAVVLEGRLAAALKRLNPWLDGDQVHEALRAVTGVQAASLIEANEKLHTTLTYGIALEADLGGGKKSKTVRFIDFERPERNDLIVTRQFKVKGTKKHVIPDVVVFVNGLPLVVIECKSPTIGEGWLTEAVEQLHRYQEIGDGYKELGAPRLFEPAQLLVATCGQAACCATVGSPQRAFGEWRVPYPRTVEQVGEMLGRSASPQDVLLVGVLSPENLLDIMRNFVVFEREVSSGRTIRKVCRYQQYAAVSKAVERARRARRAEARGGVVWHTQGSGKSFTMLWLALKLRRDPHHENPTLVLVTDRRDLDEQITRTFRNCGFPNPERAESVRDLKRLLAGPTGRTVLTTVQKFQEVADAAGYQDGMPVYTAASNVFVFVDEAHRTQYRSLAANMRQALPNAAFFGFTGTPIDKNDRSTLRTFGPYIDTYTIEQAVADGATVPIYYESRLPELRIVGAKLDDLFDRVFGERTKEARETIKKQYGTEAAIAGAPRRIEAVCLDLIEHFTEYIRPNGFKAQVVACTREAAATYKETLERLNGPQSAILISSGNDDKKHLVRHHTSEDERKEYVRRFLNPEDPLSILVVCDMLLTGFDAPIEQVMYLDSPLKEHTLLQAIARVNRTADRKTYGLVVDYWGVSAALQEALAIFAPQDVDGAMKPKTDELPLLQARHAAAMRFFGPVKDKDDLHACVKVLEPEDVRAAFNQAFRAFSRSLDMLLPDPRAIPYVKDLRWLGKVRQGAAAAYRDPQLDISDCGEKVRKLIDEAIAANGVRILVQKVRLLTPEFEKKVAALKSDEARASEMEHAIRAEIHVRVEEDPAFYTSLRERLENLLRAIKAKRIEAAEQLEMLQVLVREIAGRAQAAESLGLSETGVAIYGLLREPRGNSVAEDGVPYEPMSEPTAKVLAEGIEDAVEPITSIVDWAYKDDAQREMRKVVKRRLKAASYPAAGLDGVTSAIVDLMKARRGR